MNDRRVLRERQNFVDVLRLPLEENEHYFVRSKTTSKVYKHYIGDKFGRPVLVTDSGVLETQRVYHCGEDIVSHVPVVLVNNLAYKMNNLNPAHQFVFVGFGASSGSLTQPITVETEMISLLGWGLIAGQTYLAGPTGTMVTTNSVSGSFTRIVGIAENSDTMLINRYYTPINKI